jgi:hypothetical protein
MPITVPKTQAMVLYLSAMPPPDIDAMSAEEIRAFCRDILDENVALRATLHALTAGTTVATTAAAREPPNWALHHFLQISDDVPLTEQVDGLKKVVHILTEQVDGLKRVVQTLLLENVQLRADIASVNDESLAMRKHDTPITIREAMRILERSICFDVSGSKSKFVKFSFFEKFDQSPDAPMKAVLEKKLATLGMTFEHIEMLRYLKEATHDSGPLLSRNQWTALVTEQLQGYDVDDLKRALDLLAALEHYFPTASPTEPWKFFDPLNR